MLPTADDIQIAHQRIAPYIHKTPVLTSATINRISGAELFFKCENFQKVGAFKMRGAANAVFSLPEEQKQKGVATHSSGNHAQALALAAKLSGIKAYIVMPENAPKVKIEAVLGYGAEVFFCKPTLQAREETLESVIGKTGATFVHPYNNYRVIEGQATCAKELIEEIKELNYIVTPVGGGGLLSGTALSAGYFSPQTKVVAAEPENANDAYRSIISGKIEPSVNPNSIADGLLTSLGDKNFLVIQERVRTIYTVTEEEIIGAMKLVWERMKIIIEPSSATVLAAVLKNKDVFSGTKTGLIFSGGNVEFSKMLSYF
jgi:threonine dehydratase